MLQDRGCRRWESRSVANFRTRFQRTIDSRCLQAIWKFSRGLLSPGRCKKASIDAKWGIRRSGQAAIVRMHSTPFQAATAVLIARTQWPLVGDIRHALSACWHEDLQTRPQVHNLVMNSGSNARLSAFNAFSHPHFAKTRRYNHGQT